MSRYEEHNKMIKKLCDKLQKSEYSFEANTIENLWDERGKLIEQMKEKFEVIGEYCEGPVLNYSEDRYKNLASLLIQINEVKNRALKLLER